MNLRPRDNPTGKIDWPPPSSKIYPNPTYNKLNIELNYTNPVNLKLFDVIGNQLINEQLVNSKNEINLNSIAGGVYLVHLINKDGIIHKHKVVKY